MLNSALPRFRRLLRAFRDARAGNTIVTFALLTVPMVGAVGAGVDYSRGNSIKAAMQGALDAAALLAIQSAANSTSTQIQTTASNAFTANFNRQDAGGVTVTSQYDTSTKI